MDIRFYRCCGNSQKNISIPCHVIIPKLMNANSFPLPYSHKQDRTVDYVSLVFSNPTSLSEIRALFQFLVFIYFKLHKELMLCTDFKACGFIAVCRHTNLLHIFYK